MESFGTSWVLNLISSNVRHVVGLGMLIDGAIVVVEYADKLIDEGQTRKEAYMNAAQRMFAPVLLRSYNTSCFFTTYDLAGVSVNL